LIGIKTPVLCIRSSAQRNCIRALSKSHPFVDGNGRTGRLLMNFDLMKAGYTPAIIRKEDRLAYYDALDEASVSGVYDRVTQLVAESVEQSLKVYLDLLGSRAE
jgi:fido (protein-threonine AMPylation protein)